MRHVDIETWSRREHFRLYQGFDQPHFNLCANVDVTSFLLAARAREIPFTVGVLYLLATVANEMIAFRYRIRGDEVVEHEIVHPSTVTLSDDDRIGFCTMDYTADVHAFSRSAVEAMAASKERPSLTEGSYRDDVLYTTSIPWVSFTSFAHPTHLHPADSIPRLAWGKRTVEGTREKMPLSVQGHHALMDGLHIGRYFERVQDYLDEPERVFEVKP